MLIRNIAVVMLSAMLALTTSVANSQTTDPIITDSTSKSTVTTEGKMETTVKSPPPSAISPSINATNTDLCTVGVAGAVQTQILGISGGATVRDMNCERLKLSKTLYDMGMKVAAVSTLCQDERVFDAMMKAGTPCPYDGKIGQEAKDLWEANKDKWPTALDKETRQNDTLKGMGIGAGLIGLLLLLL